MVGSKGVLFSDRIHAEQAKLASDKPMDPDASWFWIRWRDAFYGQWDAFVAKYVGVIDAKVRCAEHAIAYLGMQTLLIRSV